MSACPGCGLDLPALDGPVHAYLSVSPACWAAFGDRLALHYSDVRYWPAHQMLTDAYTLQHSTGPDPRARRSALTHLAALLGWADGADEARIIAIRRAVSGIADPPEMPPSAHYGLTVADVPTDDPAAHLDAARALARSTCEAWSAHHGRARAVLP